MDRLLIVDDEPMIRSMMTMALSEMGYSTTEAGSVKEALELYYGGPDQFDALITDFNLGDGTGLDIASAVRRRRKDLPIVLMSGKWDFPESSSNAAGFAAYFHKPFSCVEVGKELDYLLHKAS